MSKKATMLVAVIGSNVVVDKGIKFLNSRNFMAGEAGKMNFKTMGVNGGVAALGSALSLVANKELLVAVGAAVASAGVNNLVDEIYDVRTIGMSGLGDAEQYVSMYDKKEPMAALDEPTIQLADANEESGIKIV